MSVLIKLDPAGRPSVAEGDASGQVKADAVARAPVGGRGDARIATYVKKPPPAGAQPARDWRAEGYVLLADWLDGERAGILLLGPTDDPLKLDGQLADVGVIAIEFQKFADGRGLSIATLLRRRLGFKGELRAVGDVARDQLFQMSRCGFTAFALRADQDPADCLRAFADFGEVYQDDAQGHTPLFRRRDEANRAAEAWLATRRTNP